MRYFHVSPGRNLPEILQNGLEPRIGPRSDAYGERQPCIYAFRDAEALEDALGGWLDQVFDANEPLLCLAIDADGLELIDDPEIPQYEVQIPVLVDPSRISVLSADIWAENSVPDLPDIPEPGF